MGRLDGKVAFLTGAGGGIGTSICERFIAEGASIIATDISSALVEKAIAGLDSSRALSLVCDVTQPDDVRSALAKGMERFGKINVLCNIAGGSTERDSIVTDVPDEEFWSAIKLNLYGPFLVCKHGIPLLIKDGGGSVINFSSIVAVIPRAGRTCYTSAKGGIVPMTRLMAADFADQNIRVNAISPGRTISIRTRAHIEATGGLADKLGSRHVLGLMDPVDIAHVAVYLASEESRKVTGQVLQVDSGATVA